MGNTAIIKPLGKNIGVYLHWNGGLDSVTAFLKYCELKGYRSFDDSYGIARFTQVVGNFFGGSCSIGIYTDVAETENDAEYLDNGIYIVKGWKIVNRLGKVTGREGYDLTESLKEIDKKQPKEEQLGSFLDARKVAHEDLKIGDVVFVQNLNGTYDKWPVVGFGKDEFRNGQNVNGVPYVAMFGNDEKGYDWNINNYILSNTAMLAPEKQVME